MQVQANTPYAGLRLCLARASEANWPALCNTGCACCVSSLRMRPFKETRTTSASGPDTAARSRSCGSGCPWGSHNRASHQAAQTCA